MAGAVVGSGKGLGGRTRRGGGRRRGRPGGAARPAARCGREGGGGGRKQRRRRGSACGGRVRAPSRWPRRRRRRRWRCLGSATTTTAWPELCQGGSPGSGNGRRRVGHSGRLASVVGKVHWAGLGRSTWGGRLGRFAHIREHHDFILICVCTSVKKENPKLYAYLFAPAETSTSLNCEGY
jgi:hypothetical protein